GRRVAVVVVPGVGDDGPGETLDAVAAALVSRIELQDGERRELMLSPAGNEVGYRAPWTRLHDPGRTLEVDLYEMRWADISRFPAAIAALVALLLVADAAWWGARDGLRVGLANALVSVVAYPFRIAWLAASGAAAVAAVAVTLTAFRRDGGLLRLGPERRRASL